MKQLLYVFIALNICTACGGLSKDDVKEIILASYPLPQTETIELNMQYRKVLIGGGFPNVGCGGTHVDDYNSHKAELQELIDKGYITLNDNVYPNECNEIYTNVILTDLGQKYLVKQHDDAGYYEILLSQTEFGEVTDIKDIAIGSLTNTTISMKRTYTDFGKMLKEKDPYKRNVKEETEFKRMFVLVKVNDKWNVANSYPTN